MARITYESIGNSWMQPAWPVDPIGPQNLIAGGAQVDSLQFPADDAGKKFIKAGTLVGRTYAERDARTPFGVYAPGDEEVYLLAFDTPDAATNPECELLRHHTLIRDHLLPGWDDLSPGAKAVIRTQYQCQLAPFMV